MSINCGEPEPDLLGWALWPEREDLSIEFTRLLTPDAENLFSDAIVYVAGTTFNCTVTEPAYVNEIVDRLRAEHPDFHRQLTYIEQPFPYDLEANRIDVHSVSERL